MLGEAPSQERYSRVREKGKGSHGEEQDMNKSPDLTQEHVIQPKLLRNRPSLCAGYSPQCSVPIASYQTSGSCREDIYYSHTKEQETES